MGLECLLVTCDPTLLAQIRSSFGAEAASLDLRQDSAGAMEVADRRHLDGVVIDCDDLAGGAEALAKIRESRSNKNTVIIAVVNGVTSAGRALGLGAHFVLCKPVQETRLQNLLNAVLPAMEREHRRYFRFKTDLPVRLGNDQTQSIDARMKNISEGGLALKLVHPAHLDGIVALEFAIPSVQPQTFRAKAEIVWSDAFEMGLRFLHMKKDCETALKSWLNSLEAQRQFRQSIEVM